MGWKTIGTVRHTDKRGKTYTRRVARNDETGETERTYGEDEGMVRSKTSRPLGYTSSNEEALRIAQSDLDRTFNKD